MRKARRFLSREKQVFLVVFSLTFPRFPRISKNQLNTSLMLPQVRKLKHLPGCICKFGIIRKWKICVYDIGQDFGYFVGSLCRGMLFDTNTWIYYWKGAFLPHCLGNNIFFLSWFDLLKYLQYLTESSIKELSHTQYIFSVAYDKLN